MYDFLLAEAKAAGLMVCFSLELSRKAECDSFEVLQEPPCEAACAADSCLMKQLPTKARAT